MDGDSRSKRKNATNKTRRSIDQGQWNGETVPAEKKRDGALYGPWYGEAPGRGGGAQDDSASNRAGKNGQTGTPMTGNK